MQKFILIHEHRFGVDSHSFQCDADLPKVEENQSKVIKALNIDFEEDREETITITELRDDIKTIVL